MSPPNALTSFTVRKMLWFRSKILKITLTLKSVMFTLLFMHNVQSFFFQLLFDKILPNAIDMNCAWWIKFTFGCTAVTHWFGRVCFHSEGITISADLCFQYVWMCLCSYMYRSHNSCLAPDNLQFLWDGRH